MESPLNWYGGKGSNSQRKVLNSILDKIEKSQKRVMVDVFGGSGIVALNCIQEIIVYNDKFEGLYHFFKVLRDRSTNEDLIRRLQLTPYCQQEYIYCRNEWKNQTDPVEKARCFYVATLQSYNALGSMNAKKTWRRSKNPNDCRRGMSQNVSAWLNKIDEVIPDIIEKLRTFQITNDDALDCIDYWDSSDTVFYVDPPYVMNTRGSKNMYEIEYSDTEHSNLINKLIHVKGSAIVSGYDSQLYEPLLQMPWEKEIISSVTKMAGAKRIKINKGEEIIWYKF
ncbi:DNA adenine methylase [Clostridium estertheticum]|uniref:DNA adenine methylase n=1 Tax=Clostridium estertheticum TaxID=238834 RepID=UPI0022DE19E9|nr:DNA adenine methylase [Clostridium estertheticum]